MAAKKKTAAAAPTAAEVRFSKENILKSKTYRANQWLLDAVLEDGKGYTRAELEKIIHNGGIE